MSVVRLSTCHGVRTSDLCPVSKFRSNVLECKFWENLNVLKMRVEVVCLL